ncbi:MAG TPA: HlyD family efflux transporter periplasmic adaptor subunit [Acidimicrobiales bacterium]|nr:HlyD family efflux transporter periplasmic adaptor subunit [Acidimicrobiales bacterium]
MPEATEPNDGWHAKVIQLPATRHSGRLPDKENDGQWALYGPVSFTASYGAPVSTPEPSGSMPSEEASRRRRRTVVAVVAALMVVAAAVTLVVTDPFSSPAPSEASIDNHYPISYATVQRQTLRSRTEVQGTLTFANVGGSASPTVVVVPGVPPSSTPPLYTALPSPGQVVRRDQELFAVNGKPVLLLYGNVPPWRPFAPGMSPGADVAELNANLAALGYGTGLVGPDFSPATAAALAKLRAAHAMPATEQAPLGSVIFEPAAVRVTSVDATLGGPVSAGQEVLHVSLTSRQVQIPLDASQAGSIAVGDKVSIVLPDNSTTPGVVSYISHVATMSPPNGNSNGNPTVEVDVAPLDPAATGALDQLPVDVWITTQSVPSALTVPVNALVALSGGGYAIEVARGATHRLVGVTLGSFDDADGLVQVSGPGVRAGERVVVPGL